MPTRSPIPWLLSGVSAQVAGNALDCRGCSNFGYLYYRCSGANGTGYSGIFNLEGSHDGNEWMINSTYTATATQTGTAQVAAYYPYMRVNVTKIYSGAGGTGSLYVHYSPGYAS